MARTPDIDPKVVAAELQDTIKKARKKTLNFALLIAKDGMVLEAHPTKGSGVMRRQAKAKGAGPKGAAGTMSVSGKIINLVVEDEDFPGTLPKTAKKWLTSLGVQMKVVITLPGGGTLDDGDDDDGPAVDAAPRGDGETAPVKDVDAAPGGDDTPPDLPPDPPAEDVEAVLAERRALLAAKIKDLIGRSTALKANVPGVAAKLIEGLKTAASNLSAGKLDATATLLQRIETGVVKAEAIPAAPAPPLPPETDAGERGDAPDKPLPLTPPEKAEKVDKLRRARALLDAQFTDLQRRGLPSAKDRATKLDAAFEAAVQNEKFSDAAKVLAALKTYLEAQLKAIPPETLWEKTAASTAQPSPDRLKSSKAIATKFPGASAAAEGAMSAFSDVVGDQEITPDLLAQAKGEVKTAQDRKAVIEAKIKALADLPDGEAKTAQLGVLRGDLTAVEGRLEKAQAFDKALRGKKALGDALAFGPLSKDSAKSLSDDAATALIEGFARNPELTTATVDMVRTAKYPEHMAKGLGKVLDKQDAGFAAESGKKFAADSPASELYAKQLVEASGHVGDGYFDRLDDYLASGRQFELDPFGGMSAANATQRAQLRSTKIAGALLDDKGKIDLASDEAKNAVGDMLFNPSVLRNPTPAMTEHALKTVEFLGNSTTGPKAQEVLDDMPDTPAGAAPGLVRRSLGKGPTDVVSKTDAQQAVVASMLKPLDQGPVGSCFSTAPARRLRETDPVAAMDSYAQIAGKGTYKPPFGPEVPAVTNLPADEDPIMRSLEYSLATSTARKDNSSRKEIFKSATAAGSKEMAAELSKIQIAADKAQGGIKGYANAAKHKVESLFLPKKLTKVMADAFTFTYDPTSTITDSSDGSSTTGRYILVHKASKTEIRSKAEFSASAALVGIAFMGFDVPSDAADAVTAYTATPAFVNMFEFSDYKPWAQSSGGQTTAATQTLFGDDMEQKEFLAKGSATDDVHDRAEELLGSLIENFGDSDAQMITVRTVGQHGFNATPNDPSLDVLKGATPQESRQKVQTELVDKGATLKDTVLTLEQTVSIYTRGFDKVRSDAKSDPLTIAAVDKAIADHVPTTGLTMAGVKTAIAAATAQFVADRGYVDPAGAEAYFNGRANAGAENIARAEMGAPEFVIADTNWGSSETHTFFVIAPDLATGEPTLYKKTVPPGDLTPATDDWSRKEWAAIQ